MVLTHLDLHPDEAGEVFEVLGKPRAQTRDAEVEHLIARFIEGGAAKQLLGRIELLAAELLASDAINRTPAIHALAQALVARVLAPLDSVKGDQHA